MQALYVDIPPDELPIDDDLTLPLDDARASEVIAILEKEVGRNRHSQPKRALQLANLVIHIGSLRGQKSEMGLGTMLHADILWFGGVGDYQTAWTMLDDAAELFLEGGDEVGWGRTRIGRLGICYQLRYVSEALSDVPRAEDIFKRHNRQDKLLGLRANTAFVYEYLGEYEKALEVLQEAMLQAQEMGDQHESYVAMLRSIGYGYSYLGKLDLAQEYYQLAYKYYKSRSWQSGAATSRISLAYIARARGDYQEALRLLLNSDDNLPDSSTIQFKLTCAELDLELNRYDSAYDLAQQAFVQAQGVENHYYQAYALMLMGNARLGTRDYPSATHIFMQAETLFEKLDSATWLAVNRLYQGLVALKCGALDIARISVDAAIERFESDQRKLDLAQARLLQFEILLQSNALDQARECISEVLNLAQEMNVPTLHYQAGFLLGRLAEKQGFVHAAIDQYQLACETIWQVQRDLTITLRPDFMVDKHDAAHTLIRLLLDQGDVADAFHVIERMKGQIVLNEFANRPQLRWRVQDDKTRKMVADLETLRAEHQFIYRVLNPSPVEGGGAHALTEDQRGRLTQENHQRERKMRQLTEQLYLEAATSDQRQLVEVPDVNQIQAHMPDGTVMLAYYDNGDTLWGFVLTSENFTVERLPLGGATCSDLLHHLYDQMDFALDLSDDPDLLEQLTDDIQNLLADIYAQVMAPLLKNVSAYEQLIIVPYGALHYLPFGALYNGDAYLIEQVDVTILPTASMLIRETPHYDELKARVIGHSWDGHLRSAIDEAHMVHETCGGDLFLEDDATIDALSASACKILHICAHGEFRIDRPEISFIQLHDAQLYTDDLLQQDMRYQLVVLSSCETGRADIAPGDELIGLGRGFLYAGAGAVLNTLWRVESDYTLRLMQTFYSHLQAGERTDHALRLAQQALLANSDSRHPVFWALFQLTGHAEVLTHSHQ